MSKSLGNFTNLLDLIEHGRPARLPAARAAVALPLAGRGQQGHDRRRGASLGRARRVRPPVAGRPAGLRPPTRDDRSRSATAMDDDLDTPAAMALLFDTVRRANAALDAGDVGGARRRSRRGVARRSAAPSASSCAADERGAGRRRRAGAAERDEARGRKDFATRRRHPGRARRPTAGSSRTPRAARTSVAPDAARRRLAGRGHARGRAQRRCPRGFGTIWTTVALDLVGFGIVAADPRRRTPSASAPAPRPSASCSRRSRSPSSCCAPLLGPAVRPHRAQAGHPDLAVRHRRRAASSPAPPASLPLLFLGRIVDGASGASVSVAQAAVADVAEPSERPRLLGLLGAAFGVGFVAGPGARRARRARRAARAVLSSRPPSRS